MQGSIPTNPERTYKILSRSIQAKKWTRLDIASGDKVNDILTELNSKGLTKHQIQRISE